jgi:2-polyprenyl-6-methoxyphenol hydroxylase-like FAD-dependent oxidoreductase
MSVNRSSVAIAGGGIAGMTTALLLARTRASVTLLERVTEPSAVGAGILLQPNGLAVLAGLGLQQALGRQGQHPVGSALRSADGTRILTTSLPDHGRWFDRLLGLRRSRLHQCLLGAVRDHPSITTCLGATVVAAHPTGRVRIRSRGRDRTIQADPHRDRVAVNVQAKMDRGKMRNTGHGRLLPYVGSARASWVTHVKCGTGRPFHAD